MPLDRLFTHTASDCMGCEFPGGLPVIYHHTRTPVTIYYSCPVDFGTFIPHYIYVVGYALLNYGPGWQLPVGPRPVVICGYRCSLVVVALHVTPAPRYATTRCAHYNCVDRDLVDSRCPFIVRCNLPKIWLRVVDWI